MDELSYLPAVEVLRLFRERALSPVELLLALIARTEQVEGTINAFSERLFDEALVQAREASDRYAAKSEPVRPLEGLPVAIKDEEPIVRRPWTFGSLLYADQVATRTSPLVNRLLNAGAIVHARTTTPEFSCAAFTHSELWGTTRNPWNPEFSPGGSSGGSAASVAAGTAPVATGSDIAGSIRLPAAFCGLVGFKPPYGRVPQCPPYNLDHYCQCGPIARTVRDCALIENVIAGWHPLDIASLPHTPDLDPVPGSLAGLRLAVSLDLGAYRVDPDVAASTHAAVGVLHDLGADVDEVTLGWSLEDIRSASLAHFACGFGADIAALTEQANGRMTPYALEFARRTTTSTMTYVSGLELEGAIYEPLAQVLSRYDALVCPTSGTIGLTAGEDYLGHSLEICGIPLDWYFDAFMTLPFNICSRCPVLSLPAPTARNGLPTGIQVVGRPYEDHVVFRVGAAYEAARPMFESATTRPDI